MPDEILPDVYDVTTNPGTGRLRAYVFDGAVPTLVDTSLPGDVGTLVAGIEATGVEPERLVVTHEDSDHVGGFDEIVDRYGVETWIPETAEFESEHEPDHAYGEGDRIGRFTTMLVPGHTPGSGAILDAERGILVPGDAIVGSDWRGLPEGYPILPPEAYSEDLHAAERNLDTLLDHDFETILVFHGSAVLRDGYEKLDAFVNFPGRPN